MSEEPFEVRGSDGHPGVLLIAYHLATGSAYCLIEKTLYTMPLELYGNLQVKVNQATEESELDWGQVYRMSEKENEMLRPVIAALGGDYDEVVKNMCY